MTDILAGVSRRASSLLVLFDIDGTVVRRAGPTHRDALIVAVRQVLGVETRNDNIAVHGKLDPDILLEMMDNASVPRRRAKAALPAIYRAAERYYLRNVRDLRRKACIGVRPLLRRLKSHGVVLGVVTGNLRRIGWKKLQRAGLAHYFDFGVFGEEAPTRTAMVRVAIEHAERRGWINSQSRRILVGDTPNDVEAGRANGIETVGVATGLSSLEELEEASPTLCAPDLADPAVREWFSGLLLQSR